MTADSDKISSKTESNFTTTDPLHLVFKKALSIIFFFQNLYLNLFEFQDFTKTLLISY